MEHTNFIECSLLNNIVTDLEFTVMRMLFSPLSEIVFGEHDIV